LGADNGGPCLVSAYRAEGSEDNAARRSHHSARPVKVMADMSAPYRNPSRNSDDFGQRMLSTASPPGTYLKASKFQRVKIVTLTALSADYSIHCPDDSYASEFEVQAFLYSALKALGVDVRGEVKWAGKLPEHLSKKKKAACRFDLVIFKDRQAVDILEIKTAPVTHSRGLEKTRQGTRYRLFGVSVTFIYGMPSAKEYLRLHTFSI
jgi:hypothetical protein